MVKILAIVFSVLIAGCTIEERVRDAGAEGIEASRITAGLGKDYMCKACRIEACAETYWQTPEQVEAWTAICKPWYDVPKLFEE